jgi:hypothetical protein
MYTESCSCLNKLKNIAQRDSTAQYLGITFVSDANEHSLSYVSLRKISELLKIQLSILSS